jgi:hypothetical protein
VLFIAGQHVFRAFPGAHEIELAQILGQLDRLIDHALLFLRVAQFLIARQREVLAEGMPLEAVVGQDATQIVVAREDHAIHVEDFALQPARHRPQARHGRHRRMLGGRNLDQHAMVRRQREQHVDHLEALGAIGVVDAGHLHQLLIGMLIAQDGQRLDDLVARDGQHDLAMLLARGDQQAGQRVAQLGQHALIRGPFGCGMHNSHSLSPLTLDRAGAADLALQLHDPYSSASAVGGQPGT